jgi:ATP-dependent Clp protease ATP-binding subunit ClpA
VGEPTRSRSASSVDPSQGQERLGALLASKVVGQPTALEAIIPSIHLYRSGLAPQGRPVGVFLLLGPTGTGKTRTVEAIAEVLHRSPQAMLRIDCGEFQSDHEIAKLIGAPPGYVGHLDAKPRLSADSLDEVRSEESDLALVLFDEIEKAAPAMAPLLLSILDRGILTLGDGEKVDFSDSLVFMTSNLGAREMMEVMTGGVGFDTGVSANPTELRDRLEAIGLRAVRKHFPPEFVNRIDAIVTYRPLDPASVVAILEHHIHELQQHVHTRLGARSFEIEVSPAARYFMIDNGTSLQHGARELKRVIHKYLTQPLAVMLAEDGILPGATVTVELDESGERLWFRREGGAEEARRMTGCRVLVVDDSPDLLRWMERVLVDRGCVVIVSTSAAEARDLIREGDHPEFAVIDYVLPDGDGLELARSLNGSPRVVIMSGEDLDDEDRLVCETHDFHVLVKPFISEELIAALEAQGLYLPRAEQRGA